MLPQFDVTTYPSQLFWLVIIFATFFFVISKFISPAAERISSGRQDQVDRDTGLADELTGKAQELQQRYDREHKEILQMAEEIQKEALMEVDKQFEHRKASLSHELHGRIKTTLDDIEKAKERFGKDIEKASIEVATGIIEKITAEPVDRKLLQECYERFK